MLSWEHPYLSVSLHSFSRIPARTSYSQGMLWHRCALLRLARHSYTVENVGNSTVVAQFCFHARLFKGCLIQDCFPNIWHGTWHSVTISVKKKMLKQMNTALWSFLFPLHFLIFNFFFFFLWCWKLIPGSAKASTLPLSCIPSSVYMVLSPLFRVQCAIENRPRKVLEQRTGGFRVLAIRYSLLYYIMRRQGEWILRVKFSFLDLIHLWKRSQRPCFSILPCEITQKKDTVHENWPSLDLCVGT